MIKKIILITSLIIGVALLSALAVGAITPHEESMQAKEKLTQKYEKMIVNKHVYGEQKRQLLFGLDGVFRNQTRLYGIILLFGVDIPIMVIML